MVNRGVSPVIGVVIMVGVTILIFSLASVQLMSLVDNDESTPAVSSHYIEQSGECTITFEVLRSSDNINKFVLNGDGINQKFTTKNNIWMKDINVQKGRLYLKAITKSDEEQILHTENIVPDSKTCSGLLYIGNGNIFNIQTKSVTSYDSNPQVIGPPRVNYISDSTNNLPIVDQSGNLKVINRKGSSKLLVNSSELGNPRTQKSRMSVSTWKNGEDKAIYYVSEDKKIYKVGSNGNSQIVKNPNNGANAVVGDSDVDDDSQNELVFADGSQQLRYIEKNGDVKQLDDGQLGSNNGIGATNSFPDFTSDGSERVIAVDGGNDIILVNDFESEIKIQNADAKKAPITSTDIDLDGRDEILYTDKSTGKINYVDDVSDSRNIKQLKDRSGNPINGDDQSGLTSF